jgi:hypothetical protein
MNRDQCTHPVVDEHGQCEWCHETVETVRYNYQLTRPQLSPEEPARLNKEADEILNQPKEGS